MTQSTDPARPADVEGKELIAMAEDLEQRGIAYRSDRTIGDRLRALAAQLAEKDKEIAEFKEAYSKLLTTWFESRDRHLAAEKQLAAATARVGEIDRLAASLLERRDAALEEKNNWPENDSTKRFDAMLYRLEAVEDELRAFLASPSAARTEEKPDGK